MLRIIFVRHGRTNWNVEGRVQGGGSLDAVGRTQAAALAERLRAEPIAAVYASPALRARQTARATAHLHGLPVRQSVLLRDMDYGKYGGLLVSDIKGSDPDLFQRWVEAPHTVHFEGGDRLADLRERIQRFIGRTQSEHGEGTVLAATHDSPVRVAASLALGMDDSHHNEPQLVTALASVTVVAVNGTGSVELLAHNDVSHLRGIDGSA
ncbi:MAG: histidine phosphatase family protein [Dehalococcoidia bacterium]